VDTLDFAILAAPLLAGVLVLATHVPLGQQVLARGIVFIDLAIAQVAGLGVIAAESLGFATHGWAGQLAAVAAALLGALLLTFTEKRWPQLQEALIGVLFVFTASLGILLLASNPHGGEALKDMLAGQILWVRFDQLVPTALLTLAVLVVWLRYRGRLGHFGFYALFALAVTASVQLVGIYLVFASLIVPALGARAWPVARRLRIGFAVGFVGYASGLALSLFFDLPASALIVLLLVLAAAAAAAMFLVFRERQELVSENAAVEARRL
jgi:zinc/manganese transport system permease protein